MSKLQSQRNLTPGEVFTVVFVCITVFVIVMFVVPFAKAHRNPFQLKCGANLWRISRAMSVYANDYSDKLPQAGAPGAHWVARLPDWDGQTREQVYGIEPNDPGKASISASLYLLIRYTEATPRSFACPSDTGVREFARWRYGVRDRQLFDLWDFGPNPPEHVSYSYHQVYSSYPLTLSDPPGKAVAADRSPWMDSPFIKARAFGEFKPDIGAFNGTPGEAVRSNALTHKGKGQNVLFLDGHIKFVRRPYCGLDNDNIYTSWDGADKVRGKPAQFGSVPADPNDSLLVNDPAVPPGR